MAGFGLLLGRAMAQCEQVLVSTHSWVTLGPADSTGPLVGEARS